MMEFEIEEMNIIEHEFKIHDIWFELNDFRKSFIPAFCCTVYKYQGADIKEHYDILDVIRMDKKQLYTCLSRTTKIWIYPSW